jgi:hypothetical protein
LVDRKPEFIKLKEPSDIILYVQKVVNRLRRENLELDSIGKITNLLNTFLAAYKTQMEAVELKQLREELDELKTRLEANDDIRLKNR